MVILVVGVVFMALLSGWVVLTGWELLFPPRRATVTREDILEAFRAGVVRGSPSQGYSFQEEDFEDPED